MLSGYPGAIMLSELEFSYMNEALQQYGNGGHYTDDEAGTMDFIEDSLSFHRPFLVFKRTEMEIAVKALHRSMNALDIADARYESRRKRFSALISKLASAPTFEPTI